MKISNLNNVNQSFKGLYLKNIKPEDMKNLIKPNLQEFKEFARKTDIVIEPTSILQYKNHCRMIRPALEVTIKPKKNVDAFVSMSKNVIPLVEKEDDVQILRDVIKSVMINMFN